jgi:hypothetical protein
MPTALPENHVIRRQTRDALLASFAGVAVLTLLGWTLWTFADEPPLDADPTPVLQEPAAAPPMASRVLPVAPPRPDLEDEVFDMAPEEQEPPEPMGPDGILGRVLDADTGQPVTRFQVDVLTAGDPAEELWPRLEDSVSQPFHRRTGIFFLERTAGAWDVVVQAPGYEPAVFRGVTTPAQDGVALEFALERGPTILGQVFDENFQPVPGVKAFLHVIELAPGGAPPRQRITETDPEGRFSFSPLPAGEYAVALLEARNTVDRLGGIVVADDTAHVELYLRPRHQLTVRVQDDRGRNLAGVLVELRNMNHFASGQTNENGLVLLTHVPDGLYALTARHEGYAPTTDEVDLVGGATRELRRLSLSEETPP